MKQKRSQTLKFVTGHILLCITISLHIAVFLLSTRISFFPGADVLRTIVTTCAQIIAGLYGITAAGYTFFLSRIDALSAQDMSLDYIVASLKNRYKRLMWYITGNVLLTLFASILLLYIPAPTETDHAFWYRIFCNEFIVSMGTSILLILYYSITVINPNAISKEARKLKKRLRHSLLPTGDVSRFIALYDGIERRCEALVDPVVLNQIYENKGKRFEYVIELLLLGKPALAPLLLDIRRIHRYYECTVNCSPMTVTKEMCALAQKVSDALEQITAN